MVLSFLPEKRFINFVILGVISGFPFSILYTVLVAWLTDSNIPLALITTLSVARMAYGVKYLWAPLVDNIEIPIISRLGRRKSWMFLSASIVTILIFLLSWIDPNTGFSEILYLAIAIGFFSATYDIAFDAYRIDNTESEKQGYASACAVMGYRIGMLMASTGALIISHFFEWQLTFITAGLTLATLLLYILLVDEERILVSSHALMKERFYRAIIEPFQDFLSRNNALLMLLAIILYKLGGVLLGSVSLPFYLEIGYTKLQIATIAKFIGLFATISGSFIGAYIIAKLGVIRGLIVCGMIQAFVHITFIWLHYANVENFSLLIAIVVENIGSAAGSTAEVAYISHLCNRKYSATQYALLSSMAVLMNSLISIKSGTLVAILGWDLFFCTTVLLSFPAIIILVYLKANAK